MKWSLIIPKSHSFALHRCEIIWRYFYSTFDDDESRSPRPQSAPYTTSKYALQGLSRSVSSDKKEATCSSYKRVVSVEIGLQVKQAV